MNKHLHPYPLAAANCLNELRRRACRNIADFNAGTGMQWTTATIYVT